MRKLTLKRSSRCPGSVRRDHPAHLLRHESARRIRGELDPLQLLFAADQSVTAASLIAIHQERGG